MVHLTSCMNIATKTAQTIVISLLLISLGGVVGFRLGRGENIPLLSQAASVLPSTRLTNAQVPSKYSSVDFSQFWDVWDRLEQNYYDSSKLDTQKMVDGAIEGMTASLGDPYTVYLPKQDQKRTSDDLNGSFDGVGIQLGYKNQTVTVVAPLKGLPADKAGILAGDYILHIKDTQKNIDKDTAGMTLPDAVDYIRGEKGSSVTLTFLREGGKQFDKTLVRDTIVVPTVELNIVERNGKKFANLKLSQFGGRTDVEWKDAIDKIVAQQKDISGVVLDLRNNPGGYLQEAVNIASEFIPDGVVVSQQGKDENTPYYSTGKGRLTKMPIDVLINKGSASASEIVAGALRDRKNAKLVGETSFGKGTVQDAQELPTQSGLHVTVAKWLTPSGEWVHEKGLKPSVEVLVTPEQAQQNAIDNKDPQLDEAIKQLN